MGDFNLISRADEKSNQNVNLHLLRTFRVAIDDLQLKELPVKGRRFTWSNERINTTHTKIDKVLFTEEWEAKFPNFQLLEGSTEISDHCPLLMKKFSSHHFKGFCFESCWVSAPSFEQTVHDAWLKPTGSRDCMRILHTKLARTARALRLWSKDLHIQRKLSFAIASEVIFQLDVAQESCKLSPDELKFRAFLKARLLALAAIDRIKWRQKSWLVGIRVGDATTKLFFIRANGRRRKNHIPYLHKADGTVASDHNDEAGILLQHFTNLLGSSNNPPQALNWDYLGLPHANLSHLDRPFDLEELQAAIKNMATEKAPGPDGFIGLFFRKCWHTIKMDLLNA